MSLSKRAFHFVLALFVVSISAALSLENATDNSERFFTGGDLLESRKKSKSNKFVIPLMFAALMVKSIIFPLAFKAMAVMSTVAVLMSTMSLIVSSIVGFVKLAMKPRPPLRVIRINDLIPPNFPPFANNINKDDDGAHKAYVEEVSSYETASPVDSYYRPYY